MRVHIYLWCNTNKANRIPWSSVCLKAPHGKCHRSSCNLQGMMDWKSNDIFHSYLGNIILRNKISQDYISEKCLLPRNNGYINSLNNFTDSIWTHSRKSSGMNKSQGFLEKLIFSTLYTVNIIKLYIAQLKSSGKLYRLYFIFSKP